MVHYQTLYVDRRRLSRSHFPHQGTSVRVHNAEIVDLFGMNPHWNAEIGEERAR